jgi:hypothetical protein
VSAPRDRGGREYGCPPVAVTVRPTAMALTVVIPVYDDYVRHRAPNRRYRIHPESIARRTPERATLEATFADARRRLRGHPAVPLWAKALMPAVRRYHRRRIASALDGSYAVRIRVAQSRPGRPDSAP